MKLLKSDDFIADIERQFEWSAVNADWNLAERDPNAVEATCRLLGRYPQLGPKGGLAQSWCGGRSENAATGPRGKPTSGSRLDARI